jgi:tRNA (guanine37-N1)-methyltransferase
MKVTILSLFPSMFRGPLTESILKRAIDAGILAVDVRNIRDHAHGKHRVVDDSPYGGGPGMLMKPEPLVEAIEAVRSEAEEPPWVILLTPQGRSFDQRSAAELAEKPHLALVCGHYEGVDERARAVMDEEISIGDFVLTGGEPAAIVVLDAVARLISGVLGDPESAESDSFASGLLQYPQYTRPPEFRGGPVPPVLLSGDHGAVARWRRLQSVLRTYRRRPELLEAAGVTQLEIDQALALEDTEDGP